MSTAIPATATGTTCRTDSARGNASTDVAKRSVVSEQRDPHDRRHKRENHRTDLRIRGDRDRGLSRDEIPILEDLVVEAVFDRIAGDEHGGDHRRHRSEGRKRGDLGHQPNRPVPLAAADPAASKLRSKRQQRHQQHQHGKGTRCQAARRVGSPTREHEQHDRHHRYDHQQGVEIDDQERAVLSPRRAKPGSAFGRCPR